MNRDFRAKIEDEYELWRSMFYVQDRTVDWEALTKEEFVNAVIKESEGHVNPFRLMEIVNELNR